MRHQARALSGDLAPTPSFGEACRAFARIGVLSFGGPAGQIATMHRILVEEKRWLSETRFMHALSFCMLLPGPEAMQLATYAGWLLHGKRGALVAGALFVVPGLAVMLVISALYATVGDMPAMAALFFGLKAAVLAIVIEALVRVGRRALRSRMLVAFAAAAFVALALFRVPFPIVIAGAALAGILGARAMGERFAATPPAGEGDTELPMRPVRPWRAQVLTAFACLAAWFLPLGVLALIAGTNSTFLTLGLFFSGTSVVTFGGAYAVLAFVAQRAVEVHGWLMPGEMLDGLALAETTPGPLVLVLVFVGFLAGHRHAGSLTPLAGGLLGGLVAAWVTFVPCVMWILLGAPHVERLRRNRMATAALQGVTAAVVGVILHLALWFGLHVLFGQLHAVEAGPMRLDVPVPATLDVASLALAVLAAIALLRFKAPLPVVLLASALAGLAWRWATLPA